MSLTPEEEELVAKYSVPPVLAKPRSPVIAILRWIAVLPAAVAGFGVIQLIIITLNAATTNGWADWALQLINSFAGAYAFVYAGAFTAPKRQYVVGIVLAALFGAFMIAMLIARWFVETSDPFWWLALATIISFVALVASVVQLRKDKWQLK